jgi:hypothetical protein
MLRVGYIALCIVGLVAAAAPASAQYVSDRPEADNVPPGSQIAPRESLKHRCLREERKGRLTPTCQKYKSDLNALLRQHAAVDRAPSH